MASILDLLRRLVECEAEFVLVGGMAAAAHGSSIVTEDVDVCTSFDVANIARVLRALDGLNPRQRMQADRSPLSMDPDSFRGSKNLYVVCDAGQIDLLGAITGVGPYAAVAHNAVRLDLGGFECAVMGLEDLIRAKRAMGRPKDLRAVLELEAVLRLRRSR
jgi:hypothetical protein